MIYDGFQNLGRHDADYIIRTVALFRICKIKKYISIYNANLSRSRNV